MSNFQLPCHPPAPAGSDDQAAAIQALQSRHNSGSGCAILRSLHGRSDIANHVAELRLLQRAGPPRRRSEGVWRVRSRSCIEVCRARSGAHPRVCSCHDAYRQRKRGRHKLATAELSVVTSTCRPFEGERGAHQSLLGARAAYPAATARPGVVRNGLRRRGSARMRLQPTRATRMNMT